MSLLGAYVGLQQLVFGVLTRAGGGSGGGKSGGGGGSSGGRSGGFSSGGSSGGSSTYYRGGSYGSGFGVGSIVSLVFGLVCVLAVVLVIWLAFRSARKHGVSMAGLSTDLAAASPAATTQLGEDPGAGRITSWADIDAGIGHIRERDPGFNEADFLSDCNRAFFTIQQAWTERKPDISRRVMHDGIWQQHRFQIDQYVSQNKQNVLENLAVQNTRTVSVSSDEAFDTIMVRFFASCADYDVELGDEPKVVRGDRTVNDWCEDWIFQRKAGAETKPNGGTMKQRCPNCGAPLELDLAGVCDYCRAPVMSGEFDWVLTRIEQLSSYEYAQATLPT
jgi:predicted lipid-binding transport protein (Tim44 family)